METTLTKICTKCETELLATTDNFYKSKNGKYGLRSDCKICLSGYEKKFYKDNKSKVCENVRQRNQGYKLKVILYYGGRCACCGETEIAFLTIDHPLGGGNKDRLKTGVGTHFYRWLIKNNFPPGYQVLCFNCNCGKNSNYGVCPHKEK